MIWEGISHKGAKAQRGDPVSAHTTPPEVDAAKLRAQASRRWAALAAAGCSTYTLGLRGGEPAILCLCCGLGSAHPDQIANKYCGFCHEFHLEERL